MSRTLHGKPHRTLHRYATENAHRGFTKRRPPPQRTTSVLPALPLSPALSLQAYEGSRTEKGTMR
jgi:hypothetical protein